MPVENQSPFLEIRPKIGNHGWTIDCNWQLRFIHCESIDWFQVGLKPLLLLLFISFFLVGIGAIGVF